MLGGVEHLRQMLNNYPETALERAVREDVPKPGRPSRGALPADEANVLVREYLLKHPLANSKVIAGVIGCSDGQVRKTASWKAVSNERSNYKPRTVRSGDCSDRAFEKAEKTCAEERYQKELKERDARIAGQQSPDKATNSSQRVDDDDQPLTEPKKSREEQLRELYAEGKKLDAADNRQPKSKRTR